MPRSPDVHERMMALMNGEPDSKIILATSNRGRLADDRVSFMNIGLDYDGTFTSDPGLWREFVRLLRSRGHSVAVVTFRGQDQIEDVRASLPDVEIFATNGEPKAAFTNARGFEVDVWIDDWPELIGRTR